MKKEWLVKTLAIAIILLFVFMSITPSSAFDNVKKSFTPISSGNTLYVGGSGEGNYSKIQDAIDNASDGDTVFVYNGWYNGSILINKSISVYGQDKNMTFIGEDDTPNQYSNYIVKINGVNRVEFKGFTIQKRTIGMKNRILIKGVIINDSIDVKFKDNYVKNCEEGVTVGFSNSVLLSNNIIQNCTFGIYIGISRNVAIKQNVIDGNGNAYGIWVNYRSIKTIIEKNIIKNNLLGIYILYSFFTIVNENNLFQNEEQAFFSKSFINIWNRNYWNRPYILPKVIKGCFGFIFFPLGIPIINFDWHPAQEPYDIGV